MRKMGWNRRAHCLIRPPVVVADSTGPKLGAITQPHSVRPKRIKTVVLTWLEAGSSLTRDFTTKAIGPAAFCRCSEVRAYIARRRIELQGANTCSWKRSQR